MRTIIPSPLEPRDPRTFQVIGAAMAVHRDLGQGFLEVVYQEALAVELAERGIPHRRELAVPVHYKGVRLRASYRVDFLCYDEIVVELKAAERITPRDQAQVIHYLRAMKFRTGLLINFGGRSLEFNRLVNPALLVTSGSESV